MESRGFVVKYGRFHVKHYDLQAGSDAVRDPRGVCELLADGVGISFTGKAEVRRREWVISVFKAIVDKSFYI